MLQLHSPSIRIATVCIYTKSGRCTHAFWYAMATRKFIQSVCVTPAFAIVLGTSRAAYCSFGAIWKANQSFVSLEILLQECITAVGRLPGSDLWCYYMTTYKAPHAQDATSQTTWLVQFLACFWKKSSSVSISFSHFWNVIVHAFDFIFIIFHNSLAARRIWKPSLFD